MGAAGSVKGILASFGITVIHRLATAASITDTEKNTDSFWKTN